MKGDAKVIEYFNKGLRSELTAINQYWLHYRFFDNWGLNGLAKKWREEFDRGNASRRPLRRPHPIPRRLSQLADARSPAHRAERQGSDRGGSGGRDGRRALYQEAANHCLNVHDHPSRELFEELMADEEGHIDFLETQLDLIGRIGLERYTQSHVDGLGEGGTPGLREEK